MKGLVFVIAMPVGAISVMGSAAGAASAAANPAAAGQTTPVQNIQFFSGNTQVYPEYTFSVLTRPNVTMLGSSIGVHDIVVTARSSVPLSQDIATMNAHEWHDLAARLHAVAGPAQASLSWFVGDVGNEWTSGSTRVTSTLDIPIGVRQAYGNTAPQPMGGKRGGGGGGGTSLCATNYMCGYVYGSGAGTYGMYDQLVVFMDSWAYSTSPQIAPHSWTDTTGFYNLYLVSESNAYYTTNVYYHGSFEPDLLSGSYINGPIAAWTYQYWGGKTLNYNFFPNDYNLTANADFSRIYNNAPTYVQSYMSWQTSSSVTLESSVTTGGSTKYGSANTGLSSDISMGVTVAQGPVYYKGSMAMTNPSQWMNLLTDSSGNKWSLLECNQCLGANSMRIDPVTMTDPYTEAQAAQQYQATNYYGLVTGFYTASEVNPITSQGATYDLKSVQVGSSQSMTQTTAWSISIQNYGVFSYQSSLTTSTSKSFTLGSQAFAVLPTNYNVFIWVPNTIVINAQNEPGVLNYHIYVGSFAHP